MNLEQLLHCFYFNDDFFLDKQVRIEGLTRTMAFID